MFRLSETVLTIETIFSKPAYLMAPCETASIAGLSTSAAAEVIAWINSRLLILKAPTA